MKNATAQSNVSALKEAATMATTQSQVDEETRKEILNVQALIEGIEAIACSYLPGGFMAGVDCSPHAILALSRMATEKLSALRI